MIYPQPNHDEDIIKQETGSWQSISP